MASVAVAVAAIVAVEADVAVAAVITAATSVLVGLRLNYQAFKTSQLIFLRL